MKDKTVLGLDFGGEPAQAFAVGLANGTEFASVVCRKSSGSSGRVGGRPCQSSVGLGVDAMSPIQALINEIAVAETPRSDFAENLGSMFELPKIRTRVAKGRFERRYSSQARIAATSSADLIRPSHYGPGFCISGGTRNTVGRSGFLNNRNRVRCVQVMPQHTAGNNEGAK